MSNEAGLIDQLGSRNVGIALCVVAAVSLTFATIITVRAITRWQTVNAVEDFHLDRLSGDEKGALESGREAAELMRSNAVAVLTSIRLQDDADVRSLDELTARVEPRQREAMDTTAALGRALRGQSSGGASGSNGTLIRYIEQLSKADIVGQTAFPDISGDPPNMTMYASARRLQFKTAWIAGKVEDIREAAGALYLLDPNGRSAGSLKLILAALDRNYDGSKLNNITSVVADPTERVALLRQLARLAPDRQFEIYSVIPADKLTSDEQQVILLRAKGKIDDLVLKGLQEGREPVLLALADRCLKEGRYDLVKQILPRLSDDARKPYALSLALGEGDLAAAVKLAGDRAELQPKISAPIVTSSRVTFHLSTDAGFVPRSPLDVRIGNKPVKPEKIQRFGSLVSVELTAGQAGTLEVKLGDQTVLTTQVTP